MMVQCKPLEMESVVPSMRRLCATKWQRTWTLQFQESIPSAQSLSVFSNAFFESRGFQLVIKVKSLKVASITLDFESMTLEDEIEIFFNYLTLLDSQFLALDRVEDRLFNQWNPETLLNK